MPLKPRRTVEVAGQPSQPVDLQRDLSRVSTDQRRVIALVDGLGFKIEDVALALGVSPTTVRNWIDERNPLSSKNRDNLDELRSIARELCEYIGPDAVVPFFTSRPGLGEKRPIDLFKSNPGEVGEAAAIVIANHQHLENTVGAPLPEEVDVPEAACDVLSSAREEVPITTATAGSRSETPERVNEGHADGVRERHGLALGASKPKAA